MKLTEVVQIWENLPTNMDESDCSENDLENTFNFEDFVSAIHKVVGVHNDLYVLDD